MNTKRTHALTNFPSFFSPKSATPCYYNISLFDSDGKLKGEKKISLPVFGSFEVKPEKLFNFEMPTYGMVAIKILPTKHFSFSDRHLGVISSHFYAFYHDEKMKSVALIHPQTSVNDFPVSDKYWKSNLLINSSKVDKLEIYQLNPSGQTAETRLILFDDQQKQIAESHSVMKPRSTRKIIWDISKLDTGSYLHLEAAGLTGSNAKPLIFTHLKNGTFSASHS